MKKYILLVFVLLALFSCEKKNDGEGFNDIKDEYVYRTKRSLDPAIISEIIANKKLDLSAGLHIDSIQVDKAIFPANVSTTKYFIYQIPEMLTDNFDMVFEFTGFIDEEPEETAQPGKPGAEEEEEEGGYSLEDDLAAGIFGSDFLKEKNTILVRPIVSLDEEKLELGWSINNGDDYVYEIVSALIKKEIKEDKGLEVNDSGIFMTGDYAGAAFAFEMGYFLGNEVSAVVLRFGSYLASIGDISNRGSARVASVRAIYGRIDSNSNAIEDSLNVRVWANEMCNFSEVEPTTSTDQYSIIDYPNSRGLIKIASWKDNNTVIESLSLQNRELYNFDDEEYKLIYSKALELAEEAKANGEEMSISEAFNQVIKEFEATNNKVRVWDASKDYERLVYQFMIDNRK